MPSHAGVVRQPRGSRTERRCPFADQASSASRISQAGSRIGQEVASKNCRTCKSERISLLIYLWEFRNGMFLTFCSSNKACVEPFKGIEIYLFRKNVCACV